MYYSINAMLFLHIARECKVKVMFLITGLAYGGAETQLVNLATKLKCRGWDVRVVSMLPPQAFVEELKNAHIPLATLNMRRGVADPRAVFRLLKILREWEPDILHSHMVHANLLARVVRIFCKIPVLISTAHSIDEGGSWREVAYRLTDPLADLTTNVSRTAVERYIRVGAAPKNKIIFMPNGIDTAKFNLNKAAGQHLRNELGVDNYFVWLAVGRFEEAKDYPNMLRAFKMIVSKKSDVVLLLVGQGSLLEEVKKLAGALGMKDNVRFLGVRQDVPDLMNAADAFVLSSRWEGFGLVLAEAMSCQLPVVATDSGGPREILNGGKLGHLVPPGDSEALAAAMMKMMSLPEAERQAMGRAGRAYIEANYSLEHVVDQWEALYKELLTKRGLA